MLHGPRVVDFAYNKYWPKSIEESEDGHFSFPDDITNKGFNKSALERRFRSQRMRQWRAHHADDAEIPAEERQRALNEGVDKDDWGAPNDKSVDPDEDDDDGSSEEDPSGFGMQDDCAERGQTYHDTVWLRHEVTIRLRRRILLILRKEGIALEDEDCLDRVRDYLIGSENNSADGKYSILQSLRLYTNNLLLDAERRQEIRGGLALGGNDSDENGSEDRRFRV